MKRLAIQVSVVLSLCALTFVSGFMYGAASERTNEEHVVAVSEEEIAFAEHRAEAAENMVRWLLVACAQKGPE